MRKRLDLERPVEPEVIQECIRIAIQAPTGGGYAQQWHWLVVTDPEKRARLAELYRDTMARVARGYGTSEAQRVLRREDDPPGGAPTKGRAHLGMVEVAADGVELVAPINGQDWRMAWYPPLDPPPGTPHGVAAVCLADGQAVLVSRDGDNGDLPAGRPESDEAPVDTLWREIREEACASVTSCTLLGFTRGTCLRGHEQGLVLVRSLWRADVLLDAWQPEFEITHRRLVPVSAALAELLGQARFPRELRPLYRRIFVEPGFSI